MDRGSIGKSRALVEVLGLVGYSHSIVPGGFDVTS